jgi:hypothetical protein
MGKDSLIKSTSTKTTAKKKPAVKKPRQTATAKTASTKKKTTAGAKTTKARSAVKPATKTKRRVTKSTPKATTRAKTSPAAKGKPKARTARKTQPAKKKPVTVKALLFKQFDSPAQPVRFTDQPPPAASAPADAPPYVVGRDAADTKRLRSLLLKKFDMADLVKAAAEKAVPTETPPEPTPVAAAPKPEAPEAPPTPEPTVDFPPPDTGEPADPAEKMMKYLAAGFIFLIILVIGASWVNTGHYYINPADGGVEVWQGKFAPKGRKLVVSLPGAKAPETLKAVYTKAEALPIAFQYYLDKADAVLDVPGTPDFDGVKTYLNKALAYGTDTASRNQARARLQTIDTMILVYKADVAEARGTIDSLEQALAHLKAAAAIAASEDWSTQIDNRLKQVRQSIKTLQQQEAESAEGEAATPQPAPAADTHTN